MIRDYKKIEIEEDGSEYLEYINVAKSNGELTEWGEKLYEDYEESITIFDPVTKKYYIAKVVSDNEH